MNGENSNSIKLPFRIPKYKTYSINTAINGILEAYEDDKLWLYNNYISLWIYAKRCRKEYMVDFKYDMDIDYYEQCPMLKEEIVEVTKNHNIINIIKDCIDAEKYIFVEVDTYFVDSWWSDVKIKMHSAHEMLIIGYDNEKKVIFAADFFKHTYSIQEISYLDFRMAFDANMGYIRERDKVDSVKIRVFQYSHNKDYTFDMERIRNMLSDFFNSCENTINDDSDLFTVHEEVLYGIKCLKHILKYFEGSIYKNERLDYKIIHLIYILNDVMYSRIEYMIENNYISDNVAIRNIQNDFRYLSQKSAMLRSLFMKYNLKKEQNYGVLIIKKVKNMFWQLEKSLKELHVYFENM